MRSLNGYRLSHRNKWQLLKEKILRPQELLLYEFYIDLFDFDKKHKKYGTFEVYFEEMVPYLQREVSTIRAWHNRLLEVGLIEKTDKVHIYRLVAPDRFIFPGRFQGQADFYANLEKDQSAELILLNIGIKSSKTKKKLQKTVKKRRKRASGSPSKALGSSKGSLGFSGGTGLVIRERELFALISDMDKNEARYIKLHSEWIDLRYKGAELGLFNSFIPTENEPYMKRSDVSG